MTKNRQGKALPDPKQGAPEVVLNTLEKPRRKAKCCTRFRPEYKHRRTRCSWVLHCCAPAWPKTRPREDDASSPRKINHKLSKQVQCPSAVGRNKLSKLPRKLGRQHPRYLLQLSKVVAGLQSYGRAQSSNTMASPNVPNSKSATLQALNLPVHFRGLSIFMPASVFLAPTTLRPSTIKQAYPSKAPE